MEIVRFCGTSLCLFRSKNNAGKSPTPLGEVDRVKLLLLFSLFDMFLCLQKEKKWPRSKSTLRLNRDTEAITSKED